MSERLYEQNPWKIFTPTGEERSLFPLLAFSIFAHILFFLVDKNEFFRKNKPLFEEWTVEADLIQDMNFSAPSTSALPRAEIADEAKVPTNLLPQLPKNFAVKDNEPAEPGEEAGETPQDKPKEELPEALALKNKNESDNKLAMQDALKRLALEKLRQDQKFANTFTAEQRDALARLKDENAQDLEKRLNSGTAGLGSGAEQARYRGLLKSHIGRFWSIPESYNIQDANLRVTIAVVIDSQGRLVSSEIKESSGDTVFDELAFNAIQNSVPLPKPPEKDSDTEILLNFTPKSF